MDPKIKRVKIISGRSIFGHFHGLFNSHFHTNTVKFLYQDHLWDCPKVVLKTTFGQSQRWSLIRCTLGVENEEKNSLNFQNKVFNR